MPSAEIPMVALYGRSPVNTSGGRAVVAGPPHRRSVGKGAPYGRLPVIGGRAPAKKVLLVKVSLCDFFFDVPMYSNYVCRYSWQYSLYVLHMLLRLLVGFHIVAQR